MTFKTRIYLITLLAVFVASSGSILVRWIGQVPFTTIVFYRLFFSLLVLLIIYLARSRPPRQSIKKVHWHYALAGFFLAAHLITWIASLQMTTIANSIFLESTHPVFSAIVSIIFLKEKPKAATIPSFFLVITGMFLIVNADFDLAASALWGDLLAIISALMVALYLMVARYHKSEPDLIKYLIYVYGTACLATAVYMIIMGDPFSGFTEISWLFMVFMALGPNLTGHSLLNWASRQIEIFKVNLMLTLEPILATLSGIILIAEFPDPAFYPGALLIITGLVLLIFQDKIKNRLLKLKSGG